MTSDQRKTLEALIDRADHAGAWGSGSAFDAAAAIRAALREVDALQAQVADLTATLDGAVDLRKSIEREREEARYQVDALTQQVAALTERLATEGKA